MAGLGLACLVPKSKRLSSALFIFSLVLIIQINFGYYGTWEDFNSYQALVEIGLNTILSAPMSLSITTLYFETETSIPTGFLLCYMLFEVASVVTLGSSLSMALNYNGRTIASYRSECPGYFTTMVILITVGFFQFVTTLIFPIMLCRKPTSTNLENGAGSWRLYASIPPGVKRSIATFPYVSACLAAAAIERLDKAATFTYPDDVNGWWQWKTFGQIGAVVLTLGPFIELLKYLFRETDLVPMTDHFKQSFIGYITRPSNANLRKQPSTISIANLVFADIYAVLANVNIWGFVCWLLFFVLLGGPSIILPIVFFSVTAGTWFCFLCYLVYRKSCRKVAVDLCLPLFWFLFFTSFFAIAIFAIGPTYGLFALIVYWTVALVTTTTAKWFACRKNANTPREALLQFKHQFWQRRLPRVDFTYFYQSNVSTREKYKLAFSTFARNQYFRPERAIFPREAPPRWFELIFSSKSLIFPVVRLG